MFVHDTEIRVRYGETDKMGYVYYGYYSLYYEQARTEAIRSLGMSYKTIEDLGFIMPVTRMNAKYVLPAKYDDLLTVRTIIKELSKRKIDFRYEIYNQEDDLINIAETSLIFINNETRKMANMPKELYTNLKPHFKE